MWMSSDAIVASRLSDPIDATLAAVQSAHLDQVVENLLPARQLVHQLD